MSTWRRHRAHRYSRASSIAAPGGEGWTIRNHRAILRSEPYASADLGAASDVTGKSILSEAAPVSPAPAISPQRHSAVIAPAHGDGISGNIGSGGKHVPGGVAGTIQCVLGRPSQITSRPDLHHLSALFGRREQQAPMTNGADDHARLCTARPCIMQVMMAEPAAMLRLVSPVRGHCVGASLGVEEYWLYDPTGERIRTRPTSSGGSSRSSGIPKFGSERYGRREDVGHRPIRSCWCSAGVRPNSTSDHRSPRPGGRIPALACTIRTRSI